MLLSNYWQVNLYGNQEEMIVRISEISKAKPKEQKTPKQYLYTEDPSDVVSHEGLESKEVWKFNYWQGKSINQQK